MAEGGLNLSGGQKARVALARYVTHFLTYTWTSLNSSDVHQHLYFKPRWNPHLLHGWSFPQNFREESKSYTYDFLMTDKTNCYITSGSLFSDLSWIYMAINSILNLTIQYNLAAINKMRLWEAFIVYLYESFPVSALLRQLIFFSKVYFASMSYYSVQSLPL